RRAHHPIRCATLRTLAAPKPPARLNFAPFARPVFCVQAPVQASLSRLRRQIGIVRAHEIGEPITVGVDPLHHPLIGPSTLPDGALRLGLMPALTFGRRAGVADLLSLAVPDAVVWLASLPQPVRVLGDSVPGPVRPAAGPKITEKGDQTLHLCH